MAEFSEVMRQWDRMCESTDCTTCDMESADQYHTCTGFAKYKPKKAEEIIMKWAAEHPEPQYPTWREYLENSQGMWRAASGAMRDDWISNTPIPADIAKLLDIEPKGDV